STKMEGQGAAERASSTARQMDESSSQVSATAAARAASRLSSSRSACSSVMRASISAALAWATARTCRQGVVPASRKAMMVAVAATSHVGSMANAPPSDKAYITSMLGGHGHCIAKGVDIAGLVAAFMGKALGSCKGKGGSMHIADDSMHMADVDTGMLGAN